MLPRFYKRRRNSAETSLLTSDESAGSTEKIKRIQLSDFRIDEHGYDDAADSSKEIANDDDYARLRELATRAFICMQQTEVEQHGLDRRRIVCQIGQHAYLYFFAPYRHGDSFGVANREPHDEKDLLLKTPLVAANAYLHVPSAERGTRPFIAGYGTQDVSRRSIIRVADTIERFTDAHELPLIETQQSANTLTYQ